MSYLGYKTEGLVLTESENIKFKFEEDNNLVEVVVIGYPPPVYYIKIGCGGYVSQINIWRLLELRKINSFQILYQTEYFNSKYVWSDNSEFNLSKVRRKKC